MCLHSHVSCVVGFGERRDMSALSWMMFNSIRCGSFNVGRSILYNSNEIQVIYILMMIQCIVLTVDVEDVYHQLCSFFPIVFPCYRTGFVVYTWAWLINL